MTYVEQDGLWHIVDRVTDAGALTLCEREVLGGTMIARADEPKPLCWRCREARRGV